MTMVVIYSVSTTTYGSIRPARADFDIGDDKLLIRVKLWNDKSEISLTEG